MSLHKVRNFLKKWGKDTQIQEFDVSTATVNLAAAALNVQAQQIAQTIALKKPDGQVYFVVVAGLYRINDKKLKKHFGFKSKKLTFGEVEPLTGYPVGGIAPFGIKPGIPIYLDQSLKGLDAVYVAGGNPKSMLKISLEELEAITDFEQWIDISVHL